MEYNFCSAFGQTCSICKKATVISYEYNDDDGVKNVIYSCSVFKRYHEEMSTCTSFECNCVGKFSKCVTCKQGINDYKNNFKRDLEEDYTNK